MYVRMSHMPLDANETVTSFTHVLPAANAIKIGSRAV